MINDRFQISADDSAQLLEFILPSTLDTLEIDGLIDAVLDKLSPDAGRRWIVDLSRTEYLGSSMLGLFVNMREKVRQAGGMLVLCGMSPDLSRIFKACCLERLFTIVKSRGEAKALLSRR